MWVLSYFTLTVVAAALYAAMAANSFYDPDLKLEPSTRSDERRLGGELTHEIDQTPRSQRWASGHTKASLVSEPEVLAVSLPPTGLPSTLAIELSGLARAGNLSGNFDSWFAVDLAQRTALALASGTPVVVIYPARATGYDGVGAPTTGALQPPSEILLPSSPGGQIPTLTLTPAVAAEMVRFYEALQGVPSAGSEDFWRMLYLSATTITTLGIGDIQPLTPLARVAIGVEAFLGVVFIGLFLNALASRARDTRLSV